jgi:hypothetical protein
MRLLSKILLLSSLLLITVPSIAIAHVLPPVQLNMINYQFTQEGWANTSTANVTVNFDAALDTLGLESINAHVLENLSKISADADWHITVFERVKDNTGLEKIHVAAEARMPESALAGLRDKVKSISKAGETYTIANIDFSPSLAALEQTRSDLRAAIYTQAKQEIARLNAIYPDEKYFLNSIRFDVMSVQPMVKQMRTMALTAESAVVPAADSGLSVDAKVVQSAQVTIASLTPEHGVAQ